MFKLWLFIHFGMMMIKWIKLCRLSIIHFSSRISHTIVLICTIWFIMLFVLAEGDHIFPWKNIVRSFWGGGVRASQNCRRNGCLQWKIFNSYTGSTSTSTSSFMFANKMMGKLKDVLVVIQHVSHFSDPLNLLFLAVNLHFVGDSKIFERKKIV